MWTTDWHRIQAMIVMGTSEQGNKPSGNDIRADMQYISPGYNFSSDSNYARVVVGSGVTAPNYLDTSLVQRVILSVTKTTNGTVVYNPTDETYTRTNTVTFVNNFSTAQTIAEWGIYTHLNSLIYRDVLASPITLEPNETLTITYTITYQTPNHS